MVSLVKATYRPLLPAFCVALLISAPLRAEAAGSRGAGERITASKQKLVNTTTQGFQYYPHQMVRLADGGWVVVWRSEKQINKNGDLYLQAYNGNGAPRGTETRVNTYSKNVQDTSDIAALEDGGWVVTWQSKGQDGDGYGIYQQAFNANGSKRGGEKRVNATTAGIQDGPTVIALEGGGWVVTWESEGQDGDGFGVYLQVFRANGTKKGGERRVNSYTTGDQGAPKVAALKDGGWVVTWLSDGQDGSSLGVFQQAYNANGTKRGGETQVNTSTNLQQDGQGVLALKNGGWVVVWTDRGSADGGGPNIGDEWGVFQQVFRANGTKKGGETQVNATGKGQQGVQKRLARLKDGGWVVVFTDSEKGGTAQRVYNADGSARGSEKRVNTHTLGYNPAVTPLGNGGWVVDWQSNGDDGDAGGIYQQVFNADSTKNGREKRVNTFTEGDQAAPQVTAIKGGGWAVSFTSWGPQGDQIDVYQRIFHID